MSKILRFAPPGPPAKFGLEKVRTRRRKPPEGQLNLFSSAGAQLLKLPAFMSPFEEALLLDERGYERAAEAYRSAIDQGDGIADAYCNLGILESRSGKTVAAFDCFTRALEADPRHFESHYNLATLYLDAGDLRLASMHYELAARINPAFANLHFNHAVVLALLDDFHGAIQALRKYKELADPNERAKADELLRNLERSTG